MWQTCIVVWVMRHLVFLWDHQSAVVVTAVFEKHSLHAYPKQPRAGDLVCLSGLFVDADSPGMYRQVGPQPVPQLVKQFCSRGTVVGYHAQMTMSGRVPTGIAADGGASPCVVRAPLATAFFSNLAWPPFFAFASMRPPATLAAMPRHRDPDWWYSLPTTHAADIMHR